MKTPQTFAKILLVALLATSLQSAFASPLSSLKQFLPDIAALDIRQDRDTLYVNVCNFGGVLADSEKSLLVALQKPRGGLISVVASTAIFEPNGCHEFPVATLTELGIHTSGVYSITAAALLQNGRSDGNKYNNRTTKRLDLVYPSKATSMPYATPYGNDYGNSNINSYYYGNSPQYIDNDSTRLCTAANNYCADSTGRYPHYNYTSKTMYCHNICPPGTPKCTRANNSISVSCDTNAYDSYQYTYNSYPYNNSSLICTSANNFCRGEFYNNGNSTNNTSCNSFNNNCNAYYNVYTDNKNYNHQYNNSYPYDNNYGNNYTSYNRTPTRIIYPNGGETFANNSGNQFALNAYVNGNPSNVDYIVINIYRRNVYSGNYEELYKTDRSSPSYDNTYADHFMVARSFNTSGWTDGDYTARLIAYDKWNNVLTQDTTDGTFHVGVGNAGRSDLVVEKIYQNASDKRIVARICNRGSDMDRSTSIRTDFSVNGRVASAYNTVQLFRDQCLDSTTSVNPVDLYMDSNGTYPLNARVDANNAVEERDESNNTLSVSISIETFAQKPDLVIDRVSPNDSSRIVTAYVCNIGGDMLHSTVWTAEIANTGTNGSVRIAGNRLMKGQCMDIYGSYGNLGIYRSGGYSIRVSVDTNNAVSEQSEYNNVMTQYLQTWTGN